ncbi:taurine ABC transporter permease, partial [Methylobacterium tarhaniae]
MRHLVSPPACSGEAVTHTPEAARRPPSVRRTAIRRSAPPAWLISLATIALAFLAWIAATQLGLVKPLFLPRPGSVLKAFADALDGRIDGAPLLEHVAMSLLRVAAAFVLAALIGIPLGLATGLNPTLRAVLDPFIEFYRPLPPLAYLPLV